MFFKYLNKNCLVFYEINKYVYKHLKYIFNINDLKLGKNVVTVKMELLFFSYIYTIYTFYHYMGFFNLIPIRKTYLYTFTVKV